jgi:hypothetical protein
MFKRFLSMLSMLAGLGMSAGASASMINWSGALTPEAVGATGGGSVWIAFDTITHDLHINAAFAGLSATTIAAHIHCCTAAPGTGTAGIAVDTPSLPGFPLGSTSGSFSGIFDLDDPLNFTPAFITANGGTAAGAIATLVGGLNAGRAYFNVHSTAFPGGEVRVFPTLVPEPASLSLLGIGLLSLAIRRRRRA